MCNPTKLQNQLSGTLQLNQQFITVDAANQTLATTLKRAYRFLNITALIAVLLGAVAAALVSFQYANEMTYFVTKFSISWIDKASQSMQASTKLAARSLKANRRMVFVQVIAIALTLFSLALISTIRDDLVASWQSKVPDNAPNIFVINLFEKDKQQFLDKLNNHKLEHSPIYPIVRGRLSAVNGVPIRQYVSKESNRQDESLDRDLALTWNIHLPKDNKIIQGKWHQSNLNNEMKGVSIEQGIAENLAIKLGDTLAFTIETQTVSAIVTSIRSVEWESFSPNFYMIFSPGVLAGLPVSYMSSLRLDKKQRPILRKFVEQFPSATFFDVNFLLNRIRGIAQKISYAVETVLYFALFSSILVFISIEMILRKYRVYSIAIFKAVGADTKLILKVFLTEFILIGLISGMIAYVLNLIISFGITNYIIDGEFIFNIKTALLCLILAPLMVLIAGYISVYRTKNIPIKKLLAEN